MVRMNTDGLGIRPALVLSTARSGGPMEANRYLKNIIEKSDAPHPQAILTLGIFGLVENIEILLSYLKIADYARNAAWALNLITGANLFKHVFVPEEINDDLLVEEEKAALAKGEPLYPPGEEPGENMFILSEDPEDWDNWLKDHLEIFQATIRYRNGAAYPPPSACLQFGI